jgi:hypothetical protein
MYHYENVLLVIGKLACGDRVEAVHCREVRPSASGIEGD